MSKEIEDALHMLLHCSLKDTEYETQFEQYKIVRDYITNLQQENKQLKQRNKEIYDGFKAAIDEVCETDREKRKYKTKINKAIEYIKNNIDNTGWLEIGTNDVNELLEILGDKENDN